MHISICISHCTLLYFPLHQSVFPIVAAAVSAGSLTAASCGNRVKAGAAQSKLTAEIVIVIIPLIIIIIIVNIVVIVVIIIRSMNQYLALPAPTSCK